MTTEQEAFFRRLNVQPRGLLGLNERFGRDPFVLSVCSCLKPLFYGQRVGEPPAPPKRFSMRESVQPADHQGSPK